MKKKIEILVVDDDFAHRTMLRTLISGWGYAVSEADDGATAIEAVHRHPVDLVLMDIRMVRVSGIEALEEIHRRNPAIPIILMTAYASVETAVEALKKGAYDYLTKPLDFDELRLVMERGLEHTHLKEENLLLKERLGLRFDRRNVIGRSEAMTRLLDLAAQVAPSEATVLITGESGTGKEIIAAAIHYNSLRKEGPFIKINCAAITETLLESELFGHEKGSFTGADRRREGKFRQANSGTILLDEVSEMSLSMQVKLLRVLQEREITRVGGEEVIPIDVRVITATNRDLVREIAAAGHEVASHGYGHRPVYAMTPEEFTRDVRRSLDALEDALGHEVDARRTVGRGVYRIVPFVLARRYVRDRELLATARAAAGSNMVHPLDYRPDRNPKREFFRAAASTNHLRNLARVYPRPTDTSF